MKNFLFPIVLLLLTVSFLGACSTNDEGSLPVNNKIVSVVSKDNAFILVMGSFCVNDPQPYPELVDIFPDIDFRSMAVSECRERTLENEEKVTVCLVGSCINTDAPPHPDKDSVGTDYIHSLCSTYPDRILTYITTPDSKGAAIFLNQSWSQVNEEFAVLTAYFPEKPIPGDTKPIKPSNGTTLVQLPLFGRNCEPLVKLEAIKVGDTLKIESNNGKGIDYNSNCQCNFNISYTYDHADENINFVDIDGKIFPTRYVRL